MSRTTRRTLPGYGRGERLHEEAQTRHRPGIHPGNWRSALQPGYDFRKDHWKHGRDAYGAKLAVALPSSKGPKGYTTHDEVWGIKGKRKAKKLAARYRRQTAKEALTRGLL